MDQVRHGRSNNAASASAGEHTLANRSTREVFEDHLRLRTAGDLEADLRRNYAAEVVLLTENSALQGHDALRVSAGRLSGQLPHARFEFTARQVVGDYALFGLAGRVGPSSGGMRRGLVCHSEWQDPDANHPLPPHPLNLLR